MRQVSAARRKRDAHYKAARRAVFARADGLCEARIEGVCTGQCDQVHHKAGRGVDDPHNLSNLLGVCAACHTWAETHPKLARSAGVSVTHHQAIRPGRWT